MPNSMKISWLSKKKQNWIAFVQEPKNEAMLRAPDHNQSSSGYLKVAVKVSMHCQRTDGRPDYPEEVE